MSAQNIKISQKNKISEKISACERSHEPSLFLATVHLQAVMKKEEKTEPKSCV
jgi:hypothetical protein